MCTRETNYFLKFYMGFIYLGFENGTFFQIRSVQRENRRPIDHILACNYYVDAVKVKKKSNKNKLFASWFSSVVNMVFNMDVSLFTCTILLTAIKSNCLPSGIVSVE